MAKREGWLGRLGNKLNRMEARLNERRAEVEAETTGDPRGAAAPGPAAPEPPATATAAPADRKSVV